MTNDWPTVNMVTTIRVLALTPAITRPREQIDAILVQSLLETGDQGRAALALGANRQTAIPRSPCLWPKAPADAGARRVSAVNGPRPGGPAGQWLRGLAGNRVHRLPGDHPGEAGREH